MSEYIMDLRKIVGHRTLIQCGAGVIIVNNAGEILLGRRADNQLWGYFGGSVEIDEKVEDCAKRELLEETGLIADELSFFTVNSGADVHYTYPNGDEVSNIEIVYLCNHFHGKIKAQQEEFEKLKFFKPSGIDIDMISPPLRLTIKKLLEDIK